MKEKLAERLAQRYRLDMALAMALVEAGYDRPNKIAGASLADLEKVAGIGPATAKKLKRI